MTERDQLRDYRDRCRDMCIGCEVNNLPVSARKECRNCVVVFYETSGNDREESY